MKVSEERVLTAILLLPAIAIVVGAVVVGLLAMAL
jgi:hypothetical protein